VKCPFCESDTKSRVVETRAFEGKVYRRRSCGRCGSSFISAESAPFGMKMPKPVSTGRARSAQVRLRKEPEKFKEIQGDLFKAWG
jgi:transcriptional regulator NrdR family protein